MPRGDSSSVASGTVCIKLVVDRLLPPARSLPIKLALPDLSSIDGIGKAFDTTMKAVASGQLDIEQAQAIAGLLETRLSFLAAAELEARVAALEGKHQ